VVFDRPLAGVVLDIDGTLISLSKGFGEFYSELLAEHGVACHGRGATAFRFAALYPFSVYLRGGTLRS
jgi:hypothetical protein